MVTRLDHDANIRPWVQAAAAAGATVRWADFDPATGELAAERVAAVLSPRTRLVAVTAASNLIGTRPPVRAITDLAHEAGALTYVDGVHFTAHAAVHLDALGADFFACSPYKFLGPHCGVLAADPALLETLRPAKLLPSSDAVPERFELGTLPYELLAGTTAAVDFLASLGPADGIRRERLVSAMGRHRGLRGRAAGPRSRPAWPSCPASCCYSRAAHRTPTLLLGFTDREPARGLRVPGRARGERAGRRVLRDRGVPPARAGRHRRAAGRPGALRRRLRRRPAADRAGRRSSTRPARRSIRSTGARGTAAAGSAASAIDQVRWVSSGAWMPPEARRCNPNRAPITAEASTRAGLRVAAVASMYTAVEVSTGRRLPIAAYSAPRKNTSSAAPLASVVVSTSGPDPCSA